MSELIISQSEIENRIFNIRGLQVMIDRDLAEMYKVETKVLNQAVKRNLNRFPSTFRFQLSDKEKTELVTNCDRFENLKHASSNPFAFTEQGVAMLSAVLRSDIAVQVSIQIMGAFVEMRKLIYSNAGLFQRLEKMEHKQINADQNFELIFKALESKNQLPEKGIFFDGQVFDAYTFAADLIRSAKNSIILIDNYVNDKTLTVLSKRDAQVQAIIYTGSIGKQLQLDSEKHNAQYPEITIKTIANVHDRFLIIDNKNLYHIGASLKDLGNKWFAFSKMNDLLPQMLTKLNTQK